LAFEISRWVYGARSSATGMWCSSGTSTPSPTSTSAPVDLRVTDTTLEVFAGQERLTSHLLAPAGVVNEYRTHDADLPDGPRYRQMGRPRAGNGPPGSGRTRRSIVNRIFESVPVDEQGLDAALAVLRLTRRYSAARVEAAAGIALSPGSGRRGMRTCGRSWRPGRTRPAAGSRGSNPAWEEPAGYVRGADYYAGGTR
jgi:hypothetical protein